MVMATIVLNDTACLEPLLRKLSEQGFCGATILDSAGMAHTLNEEEEISFTAAFRAFLNPEHKKSKTVFLIIDEKRLPDLSKIVNEVTGGLDKPDTGILFTVPVNYQEGIGKI